MTDQQCINVGTYTYTSSISLQLVCMVDTDPFHFCLERVLGSMCQPASYVKAVHIVVENGDLMNISKKLYTTIELYVVNIVP